MKNLLVKYEKFFTSNPKTNLMNRVFLIRFQRICS